MTSSALPPMLQLILHGGPFVILLILLSIASLTIIFQRALALRSSEVIPPSLKQALHTFQQNSSMTALHQVIEKIDSPLSRIIKTLLAHRDWPRVEALDAVQVRARHEIARLEAGLMLLEITTGISPLLGLLGTLSGLVGIFANLGDKGDPQMVALGISEALNSTILGLAVAVPSLVAFHYFSRRIEVIAIDMEALSAELVTKLYITRES
jgi:biopolymer transport protein ExbB